MPNGGPKLSCFLCQWVEILDREDPQADGYCQKHEVRIYFPWYTFCSELSHEDRPFAAISELRDIHSETIYAWVEVGYRSPQNPQIPQYYSTYRRLAGVDEFEEWNEGVDRDTRNRLRNEVTQELIDQGVIGQASDDE